MGADPCYAARRTGPRRRYSSEPVDALKGARQTMNSTRHTFTIPIGDWSDDGHGKCEHYAATAAKPIEDVREAYFAAKKLLPAICPESFCEAYEDSTVPAEVIAALRDAGAPPKVVAEFESETPDDRMRAFAEFVAWFVNQGDSTADVRLDPAAKTPMLPFYGNDKKRRHIRFFGYGLFT